MSRTSSEPSQNVGKMEYGQGAGPNALTRAGSRIVRFDGAGRLLADGVLSYSFYAAHKLVHVENPATGASE
ncbi:hypothetical protein ACSLVN_27905, partial [Klebsiella pneumoniae]|uniref:hypothetical protein n=1 Tax=Klebsiella pneumoniae TaxID=573 RepID=UPI003EE0B30A